MTQQTKTIAQEAYDLLKPIKSSDFIIGSFSDNVSKCCAVGHLFRLQSDNPKNYHLGLADFFNPLPIRKVSEEYLLSIGNNGYDIADINNEPLFEYQQETPKARVMALLKDIIKAGY